MKGGSGLLYQQRAEHPVLLMRIRKQVIMKKNGIQLGIGKKAFHQGFVFSCSRNIIPAVCRTV